MYNLDRRWYWIFFGIIMITLRLLASFFPQAVELLYSRGIFQLIRYVNDYTISLLPIPLLYVFIGGILFWLVRRYRGRKKNISRTWKERLQQGVFNVFSVLSGIIGLFLVLWGFNYARVPIEQQIGIEPKPLSLVEIKGELDRVTPQLIAAREAVSEEVMADPIQGIQGDLEGNLREAVKQVFQELGYPTGGRVRARLLRPKGILLRISTAGVYLPWVSECHVDAGLYPLQIPSIMAHELSHGYGITDEGSCNFLAYLACRDSENTFYKYSGILSYWRHLASDYRAYEPEKYSAFFKTLPEGIQNDLRAIHKNNRKYPDILPKLRYMAYNTYLKTQGIDEGIKNYDRVVMLAKAWREKEEGE